MFVVKIFIEHMHSKRHVAGGGQSINVSLAAAIEVQSHLNLTQLGQQSLGDAVKIVELAQAIVASEIVAA